MGEDLVCGRKRLRVRNLPTTRGLEVGRDLGIRREPFAARLRGPSAAWRAGETGGPSETRHRTSGQAYRLPTFRRTARRSDRVSEGPPVSPAGERAVRVRTENLPRRSKN